MFKDLTKKETQRLLFVGIVSALIAVLIAGSGFALLLKNKPEVLGMALTAAANSPSGISIMSSTEDAIINAVKKADPAVVAVTVSKNVPVYEQYLERVPSPFNDFFGGFTIPQLRQRGTELREVGGGSGFLVSADGYIVTNRHVVADENAEYTVFTNDGKKYDARVIARDPALDLAVIKINGSGFKYLTFGDSEKLQVGQTVIAIGNALAEFRNTVSVGIVSGLSRSIVASDRLGRNAEALDQLIQTDAGINQGNSGGPLINLAGEVVGVNVAMADGAENIGFALSANSVESIVESVQKTGKIVRPYLGVRYVEITEELKERNKLSVDYGVLVQRGAEISDLAVIPGSPADKAGIAENDIILEIDGIRLTNDKSLASIIRAKKVGDSVRLKLLSKGQEKTVTVILEAMKQ